MLFHPPNMEYLVTYKKVEYYNIYVTYKTPG